VEIKEEGGLCEEGVVDCLEGQIGSASKDCARIKGEGQNCFVLERTSFRGKREDRRDDRYAGKQSQKEEGGRSRTLP